MEYIDSLQLFLDELLLSTLRLFLDTLLRLYGRGDTVYWLLFESCEEMCIGSFVGTLQGVSKL